MNRLQGRLSSQNQHIVIVLRVMILLLLFTVCRLIFLAFNFHMFNIQHFSSLLMVLLSGMRFDLSAIIIFNAPFIILSLAPFPFRVKKWYRLILSILFFTINGAALMGNCLDCVYFPYTLKRTTADVFDLVSIGGGGDFFRLLPNYLADFWYIFAIWALLMLALIYLYNCTKGVLLPVGNRLTFYLKNTLYLAIVLIVGVIGSRGGIQLRPINIISAGEYTTAQNIPLVLNTPFTILQTIGSEQLEIKEYYANDNVLKDIYYPVHQYHNQPDSLQKKNVVIIILEGFSKEAMGLGNDTLDHSTYKGYTPFLDSLCRLSWSFPKAFSNGKKSIEGIPAVLASLPNLMEKPYITSSYAGNTINSLPILLKPYGYQSAFFHGGTNGTMQFDAFASLAGFDKYYGRKEYGNDADFDGNWGIWDEQFLQYTSHTLSTLKQPFVASIFTLSSHHPYAIPEKYKGKFDKGTVEIHESIGYADFSLKEFFAEASKTPWFSNTLFVITSDHSSATHYEYYQNSLGNLAIPIMYYDGSERLKGQSEIITQQIDILPSVLDYLKYPKPFFSFGESVFQPSAKHFDICYFNNVYQLIYNNILLQFNGEKVLAVYQLSTDPYLRNNLINDPTISYLKQESLIKAILQTYFTRVINNQLTAKP